MVLCGAVWCCVVVVGDVVVGVVVGVVVVVVVDASFRWMCLSTHTEN